MSVDGIINNFLCFLIQQDGSKLLCICSVIDHRRHQNVVRTSGQGLHQGPSTGKIDRR